MQLSTMYGLILLIGVVFSDPKGKKFSKKVKLLAKLSKPVYKLPLLNTLSNDTTTPVPTEDECEVVWEDKVTPICHTTHHEVCEPDLKTHCHKIWEEECWDEDVENCRPVQECRTETHEVCKTEYTSVCEESRGSYGRHRREIITKTKKASKKAFKTQKVLIGKRSLKETEADDVESLETDEKESAEEALDSYGRRKIKGSSEDDEAASDDVESLVEADKKDSVEAELVETFKERSKRGAKPVCSKQPQRVCWEEPVEKCVSVPECHTEQVQRCKKVPRKVCEEVQTERCWDEPEELCKYKRVNVATKYCHDKEEQ